MFLVIDFEATCTQTNEFPRDQMEIIEFGAVMVRPDNFRVVDEFQAFVKPVRNRTLTDFCTRLTSISQGQVDSSDTFSEVMQRFNQWVENYENYIFCSWGDYDRGQLVRDCNFHNVPYPFGDQHIDLKTRFAKLRNSRRIGLESALMACNLQFEGNHHRGIDDARNIARLLPFVFGNDHLSETDEHKIG